MSKRPTVISLFSGAGGLDYGFEAAGYKTGVCVELDSDCCETLRASRPRWNVIERSVFDVTTKEMLAACGVPRGHVDVVIGGPPCQPFSKSGYWASGDSARLGDPRADTLSAFLRIVEDARPKAFLLENVVGLMYAGKDEGLQHLLDGIKAINHKTKSNYQPTYQVANAADFGVPQIRERVFIVASRDGSTFNLPAPTHSNAVQGSLFAERALEPYRTAWDALGDKRVNEDEEDLIVRGKWAELLPSIPEGMNYLWHTDRGVLRAKEERQRPGRPLFGWRRRYWSFLLKLAKRLPSWTIQAQPGPACGPFHWSNRRLSNRELCRIQTFPEDVKIRGGKSSAQKQIGNAVPSLMGEILGREIRRQLLGMPVVTNGLGLLPKRRSQMPNPERYSDVPKEFRSLEGRHDPHPGTGLGNGALLREVIDAD